MANEPVVSSSKKLADQLTELRVMANGIACNADEADDHPEVKLLLWAAGTLERLTSVVTSLQNECERLMTELDGYKAHGNETTADPRSDRLWEIHKLATRSRVLPEDIEQIARLSEGYAPIPPCSICQQRHAEPEQNCPTLKAPASPNTFETLFNAAVAAMEALHDAAEPDTDHPDIPAVVPAPAFRAFVDEHARLLYEWAHLPSSTEERSREVDKTGH